MSTPKSACMLAVAAFCLVLAGAGWAQETISEVIVIRGGSSGIQPPAIHMSGTLRYVEIPEITAIEFLNKDVIYQSVTKFDPVP